MILPSYNLPKSNECNQNIMKKLRLFSFKNFHYNLGALFIISLSRSVLIVYLFQFFPIFYISILDVNRQEFAFIQIISYSVLFCNPFMGYFYDKFNINKKFLLSLLGGLLFLSFFFFSLNATNLAVFGTFVSICLVIQELLRCGAQDILVKIEKSALDKEKEKIRDYKLLVGRIGFAIGSSIPFLIFIFIEKELTNLFFWNLFFIFGSLTILPLIFIGFFVKIEGYYTKEISLKETELDTYNISKNQRKFNLVSLGLMYAFYFFMFSDKIFSYVFNPWIFQKFGEDGFYLYSAFYIIFININVIGSSFALKVSKDFNRKLIIYFAMATYAPLMIMMLIVDIVPFIFLYLIINMLGGLIGLNYSSIMVKVAQQGKNKTLRYRIMNTAYALASVILIPLGTLMTSWIEYEVIILIGIILTMFSLIPLYFVKSEFPKKGTLILQKSSY